MKIINLLILLLAIPPAILSTIQLMDTTLPVVSPIYDSIVRTATDKVLQVTRPGREASKSTASGGAASSTAPSVAADEAAPAPESGAASISLRPVHIGIAAVSIIVALLMFFGLRSRSAHA